MSLVTSKNEARLTAPRLLRLYLSPVFWQTAKELYETLLKVKPGLSITALTMALMKMSRNGEIAVVKGHKGKAAKYMLKK